MLQPGLKRGNIFVKKFGRLFLEYPLCCRQIQSVNCHEIKDGLSANLTLAVKKYTPPEITKKLQEAPTRNIQLDRFFTTSKASLNAKNGETIATDAQNVKRGIFGAYLEALERRPILTKSITASAIFTVADLAAQKLASFQNEDSSSPGLDLARTARMAGIGFVLSGPTLHFWFGMMAKYFPGTGLRNTLFKMFLGQTTFGPAFNVVFFSVNGFALGETTREVAARLRRDIPSTLLRGAMYWPLCDALTYRYAPVHLQALQEMNNSATRAYSCAPAFPHSLPPVSEAEGGVHGLHHACTTGASQQGRTTPLRRLVQHSRESLYNIEHGRSSMPHRVASHRRMASPWGLCQVRTFVQLKTVLDVADNSGAKKVECIKVLKGARPNAAGLGDTIICAVKDALPNGKVKKGEVVTCVVVRTAMHSTRSDGSQIRFDKGAAVVVNKGGEPIGTRVFGPVPHELRGRKLVKILTLAQHVI